MINIAVIGAGASGMLCAIELLKNNFNVTIFEHNNSFGKKLSITGNGKGNVSNLEYNEDKYYNENKNFLNELFYKFNTKDLLEYLNEFGLEFYSKDNYVYPMSNSAKDISYALIDKINSFKNVKIINTEITSLQQLKDYDKIIFATGGNSYKKTGTTGIAYKIAKEIGHNVMEPAPALCGLIVKENLSNIAGVRLNAKAKIICDGTSYSEYGNIQFNKNSISGIPVMNLSRYISRKMSNSNKENVNAKIIIDLFAGMTEEELELKLKERKEKLSYRDFKYFLSGYVDDKYANAIIENCKDIHTIAHELKNRTFNIISVDDFDNAQVTTGGISLEEINLDFSSVFNNKIHFIGECLDVDGKCGGYNLKFAFTSGIICAKEIVNKYKEM